MSTVTQQVIKNLLGLCRLGRPRLLAFGQNWKHFFLVEADRGKTKESLHASGGFVNFCIKGSLGTML